MKEVDCCLICGENLPFDSLYDDTCNKCAIDKGILDESWDKE